MRAVTFPVPGDETGTVIESLAQLGFLFGRPRPVTTILLDTFDGRLHRAGLRLQANVADRTELVLSGEGAVPAHLMVDAPPRIPADLPPGPFRSRIATLIDVRALLPQLHVSATATSAVWRDTSDKIVATVELWERIRLVDRSDIDCPAPTIEIHQVPGYTKQVRRIMAALHRVGLAEQETDTLTQCATAAGVDLAGFVSAATVPLDPDMAAIDGVRAVLANLAVAMTANWQGTIDQADPEFLHDLRIAVRRTRTVLAAMKSVLPAAVVDPARQQFAWLAGLTGTPRDLDVYLLEWSRYIDPLGPEVVASLEPVRDYLEHKRADGHVELEQALRSERATQLVDTWQTWLALPLSSEGLPPRVGRPLGPLVARRIARAHGLLIERGRLIRPDTPAELVHDLRKDAKKLRYLLECFGGLLPEQPRKQYVKRLKAFQDNLGEHQDAEVHVELLRGIAHELHAAGASPDTIVAIGQLTERLDQQRLAARAEFGERFAHYDTPATQCALDAVLEGIAQ